ncbi:hypothetical protein [Streptomyces sp. NPDC002537]
MRRGHGLGGLDREAVDGLCLWRVLGNRAPIVVAGLGEGGVSAGPVRLGDDAPYL